MYEARVAASGPGGTGTSLASNQFQYSAACTTALSANTQSAGSNAGSGSVNVTSPAGCTWSASSSASWLTITSGASYSGSASVAYSIAANTAQSARTGTMTIAGGTFTVTQAAQSCTTTLSANTQSAGSTAGSGSVNVTSPAGCTWSASSNASWLTLNGASYSGSASVGFNIAANTTQSARTGTMTIAGGTFTVTQVGALLLVCTFREQPVAPVRRRNRLGDDDRNERVWVDGQQQRVVADRHVGRQRHRHGRRGVQRGGQHEHHRPHRDPDASLDKLSRCLRPE